MIGAFDIETGPLPDDQLPEFDRDSVKLGNLKDPGKIAEKLDQAEDAWRGKLALSPLTGRVLAIGWSQSDEGFSFVGDDDEKEILQTFWLRWAELEHDRVFGFNLFGFDLPFIARRSMLLGVAVPSAAIDRRGYWHHSFVDLARVWQFGDRQSYVKLDVLAKAFGIQGKTEGVTGADFARLWEKDRQKAIEYLHDDVRIVWDLAEAMGL